MPIVLLCIIKIYAHNAPRHPRLRYDGLFITLTIVKAIRDVTKRSAVSEKAIPALC